MLFRSEALKAMAARGMPAASFTTAPGTTASQSTFRPQPPPGHSKPLTNRPASTAVVQLAVGEAHGPRKTGQLFMAPPGHGNVSGEDRHRPDAP